MYRKDKVIKKIAKIGLIIVIVVLAIPALSLLFLQNRQVQTWIAKYVAESISDELNAAISISSVNYSFFRRVQLKDLYIEDLHGDTLLYVRLTKARIKQFRPDLKGIVIRKVTMEDAFVNLVIDSSNVVNITYLTDMAKKPHVPPHQKATIKFTSIDLVNARFSLTKMVRPPPSAPWDFNNFHLSNLEIKVENLEVAKDTVRMDVRSLSGVERSGFDIRQLSTRLSIHKSLMHFHNLAIQTEGSNLNIPRLEFDFNYFADFKRFSSKVDLKFTSIQSQLDLEDFSYFVPQAGQVLDRITIDGKVMGKLNDLAGDDLLVIFDEQSSLAFDFVMIGLPDVNNTFLDCNFRRLKTSAKALGELVGSSRDSADQFLYPWINLGNLDFTGKFTGYPDQFVASGLMATDLGRMLLDLSFEPDSIHGIDFLGRLKTTGFKLGEFLDQEKYLDELHMNVYTKGNIYKGQIRANLQGTVDTIEFYNYSYSNITLDGAFTNKTFDGGFSISDPNIKLDFLGRTDFSGKVPVYKFTADVARARPYYLNLPQSDPNYFASFLVETDLSGRTIDEMNGEIRLVNSLFEKTDAQVQLYDFTIKARNTPAASLIQIRSELLDMDLTGQYKLSELPGSFRNMADRYINIVPHSKSRADSSNYFVFKMDIKHVNPLLDFFLPVLQIGDHSSMSGTYDPMNTNIQMQGAFRNIQVANNIWYNVTTNAHSDGAMIEAEFKSDSLTFGTNYVLLNHDYLLTASRDTALLDISWDNGALPSYMGQLSLNSTFQPDTVLNRGFIINIEPGTIVIDDTIWNVHASSMLLRKGYLGINNFQINSIDKRVLADGVISAEEGQDFHVEMQNLDLVLLSTLTGDNIDLEGAVTGEINYQRIDQVPVIISKIEIDSFYFNGQFLGTTRLDADWDDSERTIGINLTSEVDGVRFIEASGDYRPREELFDFNIRLRQIELAALDPYVSGLVKDMSGTADVNMTLDGSLKAPELNGTIVFDSAMATLDYLNTRYILNDRVRIYHNNFYMEDFVVVDLFGNSARVNGSVANTYLKDFYISLNIDAENVQCMNTSAEDNEIFYGTIYTSGNLGISGPPDNLSLNIKASTERSTKLFLPLYNASEVKTSDFFTFVQDMDKVIQPVSGRGQKITGLELDLDVEVTNDAVVQLIFDPKVGDIIETSGYGNLRIMLDQNDGFRMFGDVVLNQGDYLFTLQNVINKRFKIEPGGKISFNGSPTDATIDLEAIYTTRAAPYNLYPDIDDTKESLKKRIPVECHLVLLGELGSPTISPGISMPTADAETRNLLENSTSTDEELMKQFLSLLVINNFYSVSGFGVQDMGTMNSSIAGVTASELLSNQLSNWLSQISDDFDIGVNYRPGDQITSDEVEVALSTQLLDDRIIISGNVDVGGQQMNPSTGASNNPYIVGDFDVEFRVTDNVSVIAFNRARDELLFETAPYKQGIGISYKEEFNNLNQLMARYREGLSNRKKRKKKSSAPELDE